MLQKVLHRRLQIIRLAFRLYVQFKRIHHLQKRGAGRDQTDPLYAAAGRDIRETANHLCGAIVKAGQFLSLREELFPEPFTRELHGLQDKVPPAPFELISREMKRACEWPIEEVFHHVNPEPIAAGSIAQVHVAELATGRTVAVKVLRPGIDELVRIDLSTLGRLASLFRRIPSVHRRLDFVALHQEFAKTLGRELDMLREANHMERLREELAGDTYIVIPKVYVGYTNKRMLVMEYVAGANIRDTEQLDEWGVDRISLRDALLDAYLKQFMITGFVHLDPHPGNLLVLPNGKLALLDFGMVAEYTEDELKLFRNLAQRIFFRDSKGVIGILQELRFVKDNVNAEELLSELGPWPNKFDSEILRRFFTQKSFQLQAHYMLLLRCVGMLKTTLTVLTHDDATDWTAVLSEHAFAALYDKQSSK